MNYTEFGAALLTELCEIGLGFKVIVKIWRGSMSLMPRSAYSLLGVLASVLERANAPGNVLLNPGECHLPKQSVILVSQLYTIDKSQLEEQIGTLSRSRIKQVLDGLRMLTEPDDLE